MVSELDSLVSRRHLLNYIILAAGALMPSAAMLFFGTGLHPVWWLTWLAPLPVLLVAPRLAAWPAFGIGSIAWFLGGLNMWHYLRAFIHIPIVFVLIILAVPACIFGLAVLSLAATP